MADDKNLAQRALDRYDEAGEAAMLRFVEGNLVPLNDPEDAGQALGILSDHTLAIQGKSNYTFVWMENGQSVITERDRTPGERGIPTAPVRLEPMFNWPNDESVTGRMLARMERDMDEESDWMETPLLTGNEARNRWSGLVKLARETLLLSEGEEELQMLDALEDQTARHLAMKLPEDMKREIQEVIADRLKAEVEE